MLVVLTVFTDKKMIVLILYAAVFFLALSFCHSRLRDFILDVQYVRSRLKTRTLVQKYQQTKYFLMDRLLEVVKTQPNKPFVLFKDETYSYKDADELSNKAARVFLQSGLVEGDTVALFLRSEPMFLWLWMGLMKIGCSAALLNYNIRSKSLMHCFNCSGAKTLVAAEDLQDAVDEVLPTLLEQQVTVFILADKSKSADIKSFNDQMSKASSEPLAKNLGSNITLSNAAAYIYTSGTTGLPKAAAISHSKLWNFAFLLNSAGVTSEDVLYISLPLYHTAGFLGFAGTINRGGTLALRNKFSVSQFWDDCRKYNVTVVQYIGETMRYLCNTPKKLNDRNHKVRMAIGNGLRPDVWRDFLSRFGDVKIREFYGATEGNFGLLNTFDKIGAVGRDTYLFRKYFPNAVIKFDVEKEMPVRDSSGFCVKAAKGEPGLFITEINKNAQFTGYLGNLMQTEKKRLHDVFRKGDLYFNSGDLLRIDEDGFIYFQDRVGDTFRWKGENVATTEVADIISQVDCIKEANVYGVQVPGQEGRAGMAAIILRDGKSFDSEAVFKQVESFLPGYARPRFMRIQSSLDVTGTYKHMKGKLVEEGFNPDKITDPLYFLDGKQKNYIPLTVDIFNKVTSGKIQI
ncbi:long-chain fatty acid transport protein 2-like [Centropristis striata]|uniref:long-chain fatty acid transport protein 2-like n=1 Tax=Centropristis striata TaxID=184440 RepID=UPI0027E044FA|nr:long-chain fatty acid transport protein 2-like [Centropristis striata]